MLWNNPGSRQAAKHAKKKILTRRREGAKKLEKRHFLRNSLDRQEYIPHGKATGDMISAPEGVPTFTFSA
jgi:hypothetical protein